jgi:hypothetical protein
VTENERAPGGEVFRYSRDGDARIYSSVSSRAGRNSGVSRLCRENPTALSRFRP